jgi:hypothetical protein
MTQSMVDSQEPEQQQRQQPPAPTEGAVKSPYLGAVREAWRNACLLSDPRSPALDLALRAFARDGRARGASVGSLLRALDSLVRPPDGKDSGLDVPMLREWAGTQVIRSFYRDD